MIIFIQQRCIKIILYILWLYIINIKYYLCSVSVFINI